MKILLSATLLLAPFAFAEQSQTTTYIDAAKVAAAFAKGGTLLNTSQFEIMAAHRDASGQAEFHARDTDLFYILDGTATFVTGGKMVNAKTTAPGEKRAPSIEGGDEHHLSKGDIIVIPRGTPHWFREVAGPFNYYVVKVR